VLDDVRDVDVPTVDLDRLQRLVELAARGSHERVPARSSRSPGISPTIVTFARLIPSPTTAGVGGRVEVATAAPAAASRSDFRVLRVGSNGVASSRCSVPAMLGGYRHRPSGPHGFATV
jgi:hypothetical protein